MKTTIFYFSGTGNSLKVAKDLARELGDTEVIPIVKAIDKGLDLSADRTGIVFPVYMWGMPLILNRFVQKIKTNKYIFAVTTCGGFAAGTLQHTVNRLKANCVKLSAGFVIVMPGNYIPMYGAIPVEKQKKMFEKEQQRIEEITAIIREGKEHRIEKNFFLVNWIFSRLIYNMGSPRIPASDKSFWVNEKCTSCGACEKVCPVDNIITVNGKPTWQHKCEQCMACLQWCPTEAIQFGKKTETRKRYHHPEIKVSELIYPAPLYGFAPSLFMGWDGVY